VAYHRKRGRSNANDDENGNDPKDTAHAARSSSASTRFYHAGYELDVKQVTELALESVIPFRPSRVKPSDRRGADI
jgi:hypothetical protein